MVVMMYTWPENYGDNKANVKRSFITAYQAITNGFGLSIFTLTIN